MSGLDPVLTGVESIGVGVLAKEPRPGLVKTRLTPPLSPDEAAALSRASLAETLAALASGPFRTTLFFAGDPTFFATRFPRHSCHPQVPGDLGARLHAAMTCLFAAGHATALLVGSDSPDLPVALIRQAAAALTEADAVVIPAADGGYVLVGARRPVPQLFTAIPWSTPAVLAATRAQADRHAIRLAEVGDWEDIDDLASLRRLVQRAPTGLTARFARRHLARHL